MTTDTDKFVRKEVAKAIGILSLPGDSRCVFSHVVRKEHGTKKFTSLSQKAPACDHA
jgi:hypothetical protein